MEEADPEFYCKASSLRYGNAPKISKDKIDNAGGATGPSLT
ncbi:hypothetical protein CCACVL1_08266 [Corchorus capsularis]|uniref:Uncharacterized protein n=1 Tax=Corchorus capsularis TaxID=210143 RepID=A0A1R3J1F0_COCAP|nr:hypothetical protein CCACVL1_08266 [Corchorus capsularis]